MIISVVIPTKERPESLLQAIRSVTMQTTPVDEIIVVDQTSQPADRTKLDEALGDATTRPHFVYLWDPPISGIAQARNIGVALSSGDLVQFMDNDAALTPDYVTHLLPLFDDPYVGGAMGRMIDLEANRRPLRHALFRLFYLGPFHETRNELWLHPPPGPTITNSLLGCGAAYRRVVFDEFRFDEALAAARGEDLDFSYRVGRRWRLMVEPRAVFYHHRLPAEWRQRRRVFSDKVAFYHYHFRKNMGGTMSEWLAFAWLNLGFFLDSLARFHPEPVIGVLEGWWRIGRRGLFARPGAHRASQILGSFGPK